MKASAEDNIMFWPAWSSFYGGKTLQFRTRTDSESVEKCGGEYLLWFDKHPKQFKDATYEEKRAKAERIISTSNIASYANTI